MVCDIGFDNHRLYDCILYDKWGGKVKSYQLIAKMYFDADSSHANTEPKVG